MNDKQLTKLRRKHIGFVFQSFNLLPTLTAEENILLPLSIAGRKPPKADLEALIARVGLDRPPRPPPGAALRRPAAARRRSPARWSPRRPSCSPTSRPATSTRAPAPRSSSSCARPSSSTARPR